MPNLSKTSGATRQFGRPISLNTLNAGVSKPGKPTSGSLKLNQLVGGNENAKILLHKTSNNQTKKSSSLKATKPKKKIKQKATKTDQPQSASLGWLTEKAEPQDCDYHRLLIQERIKALVETWEENDRLASQIEELKSEIQLREELVEVIDKLKEMLIEIDDDQEL